MSAGDGEQVFGIAAWDHAIEKDWGDNMDLEAEKANKHGTELERRDRMDKTQSVKNLLSDEAPDTDEDIGDDRYLWVFVFKDEEDDQYEMTEAQQADYRAERRHVLSQIKKLGMKVKKHRSRDGDEKIVKIYASQAFLERAAEKLEVKVKTKVGHYQEFTRREKEIFQSPMPLGGHEPEEPDFEDTEHGASASNLNTPFHFTPAQSCLIIFDLLETPVCFGGGGLNLSKLRHDEYLVDFFPAHRQEYLEWLGKYWGRFGLMTTAFLNQPLERITEYFGSQIGLYFTFLGLYTKWLCAPALAGLYAFAVQMAGGHFDVKEAVPFFALFMCFWGTLFLEFWKRREVTCAYRWGTMGCEKTEKQRPEFEGAPRLNPVTGQPEDFFPPEKRVMRMSTGAFLVFLASLVVVAGITLVLVFRYFLQSNLDPRAGGVSGAVNGIMIVVFNVIYSALAEVLTNWENHKTQTEYDDSLIMKSFGFQFVNSYAPFYIVGFVKPYAEYFGTKDAFGDCQCIKFNQDSCTQNDIIGPNAPTTPAGSTVPCACDPHGYSCLDELGILLISIFGVQLFIGNVMEFGVPWIKARVAMYLEEKAMKEKLEKDSNGSAVVEVPPLCQAEFEAKMEVYPSPFEDYNEMVIQYGYVSLFAAAFPLCGLLALLNNIIEIRSDAYKMLKAHQRPIPRATEDIGSWFLIMDLMTYICVLTNCALVWFTSGLAQDLKAGDRIWGFILSEHIIIGIKVFMSYAIPDTPRKTQEAMEREDYRKQKSREDAAAEDQGEGSIAHSRKQDDDFFEDQVEGDESYMEQ